MAKREYEREFEISMLFHPAASEGCLVKSKTTDLYKNPTTEDMYQGFVMASKADAAQLKRFDPDRNMPMGFMTELRQEAGVVDLHAAGLATPPDLMERIARATLKVAAGCPR